MDIICEDERLSQVWFDAHAQKIMGSGVISPPHDFKLRSRWYCRVYEGIKYGIRVVMYAVTPIPNFMNFHQAILLLLYATNRASIVKTSGLGRLG
jgi:hypothetical protein